MRFDRNSYRRDSVMIAKQLLFVWWNVMDLSIGADGIYDFDACYEEHLSVTPLSNAWHVCGCNWKQMDFTLNV